jgi:Arc/MetJ-type ribon-helix-helix transcriptional regulator
MWKGFFNIGSRRVVSASATITQPDFYFAYLDTSMTTNKRAIVRLPESLVDRLDAVAFDLRMRSRSDYIRRSLERAVDFSETHELPLLEDPELQRALANKVDLRG